MEMERAASGKVKSRRARMETHRALLQRFVDIVGPRARHHRPRATSCPTCASGATAIRGARRWCCGRGPTEELRASWRSPTRRASAVVPQAGNTGLVGGQIPSLSGAEIVLSVSPPQPRARRRRAGSAMTVEAGLTLAEAQAARRAGRPPVSAEPAVGGKLPDRRQPRHQRRRRRRARLRQRARPGARARGGARRTARVWNGLKALQEGQHRLRPARPLHRLGGHARHHHGGRAEAVPAARGEGDGASSALPVARRPRSRSSAWPRSTRGRR